MDISAVNGIIADHSTHTGVHTCCGEFSDPDMIVLVTWILSGTPVLSMRLATFTVLPQMSYCGFRAPMTPATTGPMLRPEWRGKVREDAQEVNKEGRGSDMTEKSYRSSS